MKPARKQALLKVEFYRTLRFIQIYQFPQAFSSFPDTTFIWKYENKSDDFAKFEASRVQNVILIEWMPQKDILGMDQFLF